MLPGNFITACLLIWINLALLFNKGECNNEVISVRVGRTAHLPCDVTQPDLTTSPYVIEWSRESSSIPVYIKIGRYPAKIDPHFRGRMSLKPNSATLRIERVVADDDGWYVCRVLYLDHPVSYEDIEIPLNGTWLRLTVTAPPTITFSPPFSVERRERESLLLRCRIEGRPKPEITWRKDGWLLKDWESGIRINGGELEVSSLQRSHRGVYECQGTNADGQVEHATTVLIKAPPEMTVAPKNVTVKEGQEAFFTCKAIGYPANITYSWLYNGVAVSTVQSLHRRQNIINDGTLVLYNVNRNDKGEVTCLATNGYGQPLKASAFLIIKYLARVTKMPHEVFGGLRRPLTVHCQYEAYPPVTVVAWRKDGELISNEQEERVHVTVNGSLFFKSVQSSDEGRYTCTPYNILGTRGQSPSVLLIPKEPPQFTVLPKAETEVEVGEKVQLYCAGNGDPKPVLSWKKVIEVDQKFPNDRMHCHSGNITISSVQLYDHGLWQCTLSNSVAQIVADAMLLVKYTTPQKVTNVTVRTDFQSAVVTWTPGYDGGYPQHFVVWYKRSDKGDHAWSTIQVPGSHQQEVVSRLKPETIYEFAVLPENILGSGPFSKVITTMTEVIPTRPPAQKFNSIPAPRNLTSYVNKDGILVLSWNVPESIYVEDILGFIVEYRMLSKEEFSFSPIASTESPQQKETLKRLRRLTSTFEDNIKRVVKRSSPFKVLKEPDGIWRRLGHYTANTTRIEVPRKKLFREQLYEFHVLAVTPIAYGTPSIPIAVETFGMASYGLLAVHQSQISAGVAAGIAAGTVFILFVSFVSTAYCICRHKGSNSQAKEKTNKRFMANGNCDSLKPLTQPSSSGATSTADDTSKEEGNVNIVANQKGVFQKIKSKLERGKSSVDAHKRPLIQEKKVKRTQSLPHGNSSKPIDPIYRSTDGKFHLNSLKNTKPSVGQVIRRNNSERRYADSDAGEPPNYSRKREKFRKSRPVSDSVLHQDAAVTRKYWTSRPPRDTVIQEIEEGCPQMEIDCSQSNIEVRYISSGRINPRHSFRERSLLQSSSSAVADTKFTSTKQNTTYVVPSHMSAPSFQRRHFRTYDGCENPQQTLLSPLLVQPEYVYLKDIDISGPGTPYSDISDPRCFSPSSDVMSSRNHIPSNPSRVRYNTTSSIARDNFNLSPRASYSERSNLRHFPHSSPHHWKEERVPQGQQYQTPLTSHYQSNLKRVYRNLSNQNVESTSDANAIHLNNLQREKKYHSLPSPHHKPVHFSDKESDEKEGTPPSTPTETIMQRNNNNNGLVSTKSPTLRTHSFSLPSISQRKMLLKLENRSCPTRRSASEELLGNTGPLEDLEGEGDMDSVRHFSFTSGSASTVRHVPSRESNLSAVDGCSNDKRSLASSHEQDYSTSFSIQYPHSEKSSISISPVVPLEAARTGSSSGYDSQNASSENSSHGNNIRPYGPSNSSYLHRNLVQSPSNLPSHEGFSNPESSASNRFETRGSISSSNESKSRKDTSSVDEKYEWDSTTAIESEILEALRQLGAHKRDEPVSKDVIQELQKLNVNETDASPSPQERLSQETTASPEELSDSDDDSYSKETIEQRCAALKEEYLQHKNRVMARRALSFSNKN